MFKDDPGKVGIVKKIVRGLTDYPGNKSHAGHIHIEECKTLGLKVLELESGQKPWEPVLAVHHLFIHTLMNMPPFRIIENRLGRALVRTLLPG